MESANSWVLLVILALAYFIPTMIAQSRHTHNQTGVAIINLLIGWTIIGWLIALIIAGSSRSDATASSRGANIVVGLAYLVCVIVAASGHYNDTAAYQKTAANSVAHVAEQDRKPAIKKEAR